MNKRQAKKQLKKIGVSLWDVHKDPVRAARETTAILATTYKSSDWQAKIAVMMEIERLQRAIQGWEIDGKWQ